MDSQHETDLEKCCSSRIHDLHQVELKNPAWFKKQLGFVLGIRLGSTLPGWLWCSGVCRAVERSMLLGSTVLSALSEVVSTTSLHTVARRVWR